MKKLGLVLGGGRGAYHIGIWKYLIESGIYDKVSAISGGFCRCFELMSFRYEQLQSS